MDCVSGLCWVFVGLRLSSDSKKYDLVVLFKGLLYLIASILISP